MSYLDLQKWSTLKKGGDMFKTTLQKLALLKAAVKSCILYSTNVPVHLHLHMFKINVALRRITTCIDFQCSHSREDIVKTWTSFLSIGTRVKNKYLSLVNEMMIIIGLNVMKSSMLLNQQPSQYVSIMNCVIVFHDFQEAALIYFLWLCKKKQINPKNQTCFDLWVCITVKQKHCSAKIYIWKKRECVLENMIKSWSFANIQRTPEKCGRYFVYLRVKTGELILIAWNKKYKNITYIMTCIYKDQ